MPLFYPVAGRKIYIGGVITDKNIAYTAADFAAITWTRINGWNQMGALGQMSQSIDVPLIDQAWDATMKGTRQPMEMVNRFATQNTDAGQIAMIAAELSREFFAFKIEDNDQTLGTAKAVTMTVATPGVFTSATHGYANGTPVQLSTTGALPGGVVAGDTYYVIETATNTFQLSLTSGGAAIATTGTQSGTHTVASVGLPSQRLIAALVMGVTEPNGEANTASFLEATLRRRMTPVKVAASAAP